MLVEEKMLLMAQRSRQNYVERMGPVLVAQPAEVAVLERSVPTVAGETVVLIYKPCGLPTSPLRRSMSSQTVAKRTLRSDHPPGRCGKAYFQGTTRRTSFHCLS